MLCTDVYLWARMIRTFIKPKKNSMELLNPGQNRAESGDR
jgi:hypothetical protein